MVYACDVEQRAKRRAIIKAIALISGELLFLEGCVLFLPNRNINTGAWVYLLGCSILISNRVHSLVGLACRACDGHRVGGLDLAVSVLYLMGLLAFAVGSGFFIRCVAMYYSGEVLFTIGTLFFVLGSYVDVVRAVFISDAKSWHVATLDCLTAVSYVIGSNLRLCGRIVYFLLALGPKADTTKLSWAVGIQCIVGSCFFVSGSIFNFALAIINQGEDERQCDGTGSHLPLSANSPTHGMDNVEDGIFLDVMNDLEVPSSALPYSEGSKRTNLPILRLQHWVRALSRNTGSSR